MAGLFRFWRQLPVDLQDRIINLLDPNEIACSVRPISKAAAARYSGPQHTRIRLSQPVPAHAFQHRWCRPGSLRSLSLEQRKQLLTLTSTSGSIPNLQLLLPVVGCTLDADMFTAVAASGQLAACQWLREQGCPWGDDVLDAAGRSGNMELCDWLIAAGCPGDTDDAQMGAARGGHVDVVDRMLASYGPPEDPGWFLQSVAAGCDLPTLLRFHTALYTDGEQIDDYDGGKLTIEAAGSALPDWREKLEWLEAQGCPRDDFAPGHAACCPDAVDRLKWFAARGWPMDQQVAATRALGNVEALALVLGAPGPAGKGAGRPNLSAPAESAAMSGHVAGLRLLHAHGCSISDPDVRRLATSCGRLHVVAWLVEALGAEEMLTDSLFYYAARSGSLPLMAWLRERGCLCRDPDVLEAATSTGASEEVLEWLLEQGCELEMSADCWYHPARSGDLATLAWLRRMGSPWAADGSTFTRAVNVHCALPVLSFLVEAGCPCAADGSTFTAALAACYPLPVLRWLVEAGCAVDLAAALHETREGECRFHYSRNPEAVAWLEQQHR